MMRTDLPEWACAIGLDRSLQFLEMQVGSGLLSEQYCKLVESMVVEEYRLVAEDLVDMVEHMLGRAPRDKQLFRTRVDEFCRGQTEALEERITRSPSAQERFVCTIRKDAWIQMGQIVNRSFPATWCEMRDLTTAAVA